ncbi:MAG: MoaD/ThiS family protein [Chloroflexota bacterium]
MKRSAGKTQVGKVRLEFLPSLAESLGVEPKSEEVISKHGHGGTISVADLLKRLGIRYQRFSQMVFDVNTQTPTGVVAIFLNGHSLDIGGGLTSKLSDGDTLTFVPIIEGG